MRRNVSLVQLGALHLLQMKIMSGKEFNLKGKPNFAQASKGFTQTPPYSMKVKKYGKYIAFMYYIVFFRMNKRILSLIKRDSCSNIETVTEIPDAKCVCSKLALKNGSFQNLNVKKNARFFCTLNPNLLKSSGILIR